MARIIHSSLSDKKWIGPFPNKAGEFCEDLLQNDIVITEGVIRYSLPHLHLPDNTFFRIGEPSEVIGVVLNQEEHGYVGLYLTEDQPVLEDEECVDTDIFHEEVVTGKRPSNKPFTLKRSKGL